MGAIDSAPLAFYYLLQLQKNGDANPGHAEHLQVIQSIAKNRGLLWGRHQMLCKSQQRDAFVSLFAVDFNIIWQGRRNDKLRESF